MPHEARGGIPRGVIAWISALVVGRHSVSRLAGTPVRVEETRISDPRTNDRIRVPEVRLVGPEGEQVGIVSIGEAMRMAQEADLDRVEVAPMARPPVCKIMDSGKCK